MTAIKLKELGWSGMFSYGSGNKLDLTKNVITQLDAINGTGKTAIVLIIQELLFSKNMKDIKKGDIVNRYAGSDSWDGYLIFEVDEIEYKIEVKRKGATSKVTLWQSGKNISEHKIPDTYKKILSTILKASIEVLNQLMYQSSNTQLEFLKATDTNRKKFLVNLLNLERYLQIGEVLKLKVSETERSLAGLNGEQKAVQDFLNQPMLSNLEKKVKITVPEVSEELKDEIRKLEVDISNYDALCRAIDKNNILKKERLEITFQIDLQEVDKDFLKQIQENLAAGKTEVSIISKQLDVDKKSLASLDTATECPTCHQPIDNSQSIKMADTLKMSISGYELKLNEQQKIVAEFTAKERELLNHKAQYDSNLQKMQRFEQLSSLIDKNLQENYPNIASAKQDLTNKKGILEKQVRAQTDAMKFNSEVDISNAKVDTIVNQKREFLARQELLSSDIINLQLKLDRLTTLRKAFSPTGIVAFKLENIIKEFENQINEYLVELSDGQFQINFRLEGEKLNIIVFSNGIESPIESASEGEFSRIQASTLLAIRKLLSKMGGIHINFLFLDEVMGVLDKSGKERLIEILQREENTNTFIVAHDFSHPLVPKLKIVKENNIARIVV